MMNEELLWQTLQRILARQWQIMDALKIAQSQNDQDLFFRIDRELVQLKEQLHV